MPVANFLFGRAESEVSSHLTRAESQAAKMVGVLKVIDLGLFENPVRLMLWLTPLAGGPNAITS